MNKDNLVKVILTDEEFKNITIKQMEEIIKQLYRNSFESDDLLFSAIKIIE